MNRRAALYMLISAGSFAMMNLLVKQLEGIGALQIVFGRCITSVFMCLVYLWGRRIPPLGQQRRLLLARGVTGTLSMALFFYAIKLMPLGSAVSLRYLSPLFGVVLALAFLREYVRPVQWFFLFLACAGAMLLSGLERSITPFALLVILGSAFFSGVVFVLIRRLGTAEDPIVIVLYFMVVGSLVGGLGAIPTWVQPNPRESLLQLIIGTGGFFGQMYYTKAVQIEVTSKVAPLKYIEAIFVLVLSYFIYEERYALPALAGIGLIIIGNLGNAFVKRKVPREND